MSQYLLFDSTERQECIYKNEHYSVREDGSVFRHKPIGKKRKRPLDETWTFGKKNKRNGYMTIGGASVHIIVATAFHGKHDSSKYVVDHIDTNRCNNRPSNLKWVTRMENILNNPITKKKVEFLCGGNINKFIENPNCLKQLRLNYQNVGWMRHVSNEESQNMLKHMILWQNKPTIYSSTGSIGEWIFQSPNISKHNENLEQKKYITKYRDSLTPNAKQESSWKTPTFFPLCPNNDEHTSIIAYLNNLEVGKIITINYHSIHFIDDFKLYNQTIYIRTHTTGGIKNFSLISITLQNNNFVHVGRTFFEERGAKKSFCEAIGEKWNGEDGIDDYC